ncbi:MAG: DNA internalization-related competence protein ComEC/Rec2 [Proteobacteria bacterium]|nr:DNA internalization-related competence protein ComEC/Rec2 [Pseudomonadota bacterium]
MKGLKNIFQHLKDLNNSNVSSTTYISIAFFAFSTGVLFFYSKYFNPIIFILLLLVPLSLYLLKENTIPFFIFYCLFFFCLGVLRTSFTFNEIEGLVKGKGKISGFVKSTKHYKQADMKVEVSNVGNLVDNEARFDLNSNISTFDRILFEGELRKPIRYKNINSLTSIYESFLESRRILKIREFKLVSKNDFFSYLMDIRDSLIKRFESSKMGGKDFFKEVLFGEKSLSDNVREIFSKSGTAHILSISGLHFSLTVFFAYAIVYIINILFPKTLDLKPRQVLAVFVSLPLLFIYAFLSGLSIPAMRAFLFFMFSSIFLLFFKKSFNPFNLLYLVALLFVVDNPAIIFSLSFQLSFLSVFALLSCFNNLNLLKKKSDLSWKARLLNYSISTVVISLVISLFIFPILNSFTRQNLLISTLANPVVIPLFSFFVLPFLFISLPFAFINEGLFSSLLLVPELGWKVISLYLNFLVTKIPEVFLNLNFSITSLIIYYLTLLFALFLRRKIRFLIILVGILLVFIFSKEPLKGPILIFPDVGQGDCAVIKTDEGKFIFIDAGGNTWDETLSKRVYMPLFNKLGIKKIDFLIISHPHPDHSGMVNWLNKNFRVEKTFSAEDILSWKNEILINDDNWKFYILPGIDGNKENNRSCWVIIEYGKKRILFTGDTERDGIEYMLRRYGNLFKEKIDILKIPHHGAESSFNKRLYDIMAPKFAVITVGDRNPWGLPSKKLIHYLKERQVSLIRTDRDGEVIFNLKTGEIITYRDYYGI